MNLSCSSAWCSYMYVYFSRHKRTRLPQAGTTIHWIKDQTMNELSLRLLALLLANELCRWLKKREWPNGHEDSQQASNRTFRTVHIHMYNHVVFPIEQDLWHVGAHICTATGLITQLGNYHFKIHLIWKHGTVFEDGLECLFMCNLCISSSFFNLKF